MGDIHQTCTGPGGFAQACRTRRAVLRLLAQASIVAPVAVLVACRAAAPSSAPAPTSSSSGKLEYPTYVPFQGPPPDLPGSAEGVAPAYFSFPKNLTKSVAT